MQSISALLLGISTNLDNLLLGFTFGAGGRRISSGSNWAIGLFSAAAACLFCCTATLFSAFGPMAERAGAMLLILTGFFSMLPPRDDRSDAKPETAVLGAALAINCIPAAFGAGLAGIPPLAAAASVGFLSVLTVRLGNLLGQRAASLPLHPAALRISGGLLLAALGVVQLLE